MKGKSAREIGVDRSTICRELKRNMTFVRTKLGYWTYKPNYAQCYADDRRKVSRNFYKFTKEVDGFVIEKTQEDWSPEQIRGYAKRIGIIFNKP